MEKTILCLSQINMKCGTQIFLSFLANLAIASLTQTPTNKSVVGVYGEHLNAALRFLRRCFHICTPLFSSHPCFSIHKHSVQVKDILIWRLRVYSIDLTRRGCHNQLVLLNTDISLGNRISTVNAARITFKPQIEFKVVLNAFSVLPCAGELFIYLAAFMQHYNSADPWNGHQAGGLPAVLSIIS